MALWGVRVRKFVEWFAVGSISVSSVLAAGSALAGEVWLRSDSFSAARPVPHIHFEGPVTEGDLARIPDAVAAHTNCSLDAPLSATENCAVLTLSSEGGSYVEGLQIARALRELGIATWVESGDYCYSACAFAFLGGTGYAQDTGGAFIDRTIEPGAILGFHAPYFASDGLDDLVAKFGVEEVLGGTRDNIALMIQELVHWNVDASVLSYITSMGADDAYTIETPLDLYLTRIALPNLPLAFWEPVSEEALFNACTRLLAYHNSDWPTSMVDVVQGPMLYDIGFDEAGRSLSGYQVSDDVSGIKISYCAVPTDEVALDGDADISLYFGPGIKGQMRPALSLFQRPQSWSTLGTGGAATQRILQKGPLNHAFIDVEADLDAEFGLAWVMVRDDYFSEGYLP